MKKDVREYKIVVLEFLSELYERCFRGEISEDEQNLLEKSSNIIRKGNPANISDVNSKRIQEEVYAFLSDRIRSEKKLRRTKRMILYATSFAAVLAVCFYVNTSISPNLNIFSTSKERFTSICTDSGSIREVELEDGTKISMNQDTHIGYYATEFNKQKREIWLTGEASFDVAKNQKKPFIIHSGSFSVKVLGTSFNIKSYPNLNQYIVSVRRGKVNVSKDGKNLGNLMKNKELSYNIQNNSFAISDKDCSEVDKWRSGSLVLNNADKDELVFRMKQYYGVEIKVSSSALPGVMINGVYDKSDSPEDVIKSICFLYNIKYMSKNGVITILP